jgi:hypothetical protein
VDVQSMAPTQLTSVTSPSPLPGAPRFQLPGARHLLLAPHHPRRLRLGNGRTASASGELPARPWLPPEVEYLKSGLTCSPIGLNRPPLTEPILPGWGQRSKT